jgi:hypothetical protein
VREGRRKREREGEKERERESRNRNINGEQMKLRELMVTAECRRRFFSISGRFLIAFNCQQIQLPTF